MKGLLLVLLTVGAWAQPVFVYSEFARIDTKTGDVIAPESPREILSPAVVRNGFTSFQLVVQAPAGDKWWLFIGQNPENAVKVTMYRESTEGIEPIDLPIQSEGTQVFWMDVWTGGDAPVRRVKLEPELSLHDDWIIYPMEARVVDARIPEGRSDALGTPVEAMHGFLCGQATPGGATPGSTALDGVSIPSLRLRNARQDLLVAAGPSAVGPSKDELKNLFGDCTAPASPDPEWYLRIRDYLFRLR